jgi:hypothetical protein
VRSAGLLLGKRLIKKGEVDLGRLLIAKVYVHDASKFYGIQWDYMHAGNDVAKERLELAIREHQLTNDHHVEFWGRFEDMPVICLAEMACDWLARSQEFGTSLREWITDVAISKYKIDTESCAYRKFSRFVDLLLEDHYVK